MDVKFLLHADGLRQAHSLQCLVTCEDITQNFRSHRRLPVWGALCCLAYSGSTFARSTFIITEVRLVEKKSYGRKGRVSCTFDRSRPVLKLPLQSFLLQQR